MRKHEKEQHFVYRQVANFGKAEVATAVVGIFFTIQNVDTSYFDLSLVDSEGSRSVILHGEDFRTNQEGSGSWEKALAPGAHQLVLTADQNPGVLSVYWESLNQGDILKP